MNLVKSLLSASVAVLLSSSLFAQKPSVESLVTFNDSVHDRARVILYPKAPLGFSGLTLIDINASGYFLRNVWSKPLYSSEKGSSFNLRYSSAHGNHIDDKLTLGVEYKHLSSQKNMFTASLFPLWLTRDGLIREETTYSPQTSLLLAYMRNDSFSFKGKRVDTYLQAINEFNLNKAENMFRDISLYVGTPLKKGESTRFQVGLGFEKRGTQPTIYRAQARFLF